MAEQRQRMKPLRVTALLGGAVCTNRPIHLDALLAYAVVLRDEIDFALCADDVVPVEIPVQREPGGRFHLASVGLMRTGAGELRYTNRRAPIEEYQTIGTAKIKTCKINLGANKSYRIPRQLVHAEDDRVDWFCIGDHEEIRSLLADITHLGKRRGVGWGKVREWIVEPCAPWLGFPVLREGAPLRNLPSDWPDLNRSARQGHATLTYPYWDQTREELCLLPTV